MLSGGDFLDVLGVLRGVNGVNRFFSVFLDGVETLFVLDLVLEPVQKSCKFML